MIKTLVVVASGGALAFGLAGVASPAMAWGSVTPAGVTQANLPMPGPPPIIRRSDGQTSGARLGGAGGAKLMAPSDPPIIRGSTARLGDPDDGGQVTAASQSEPTRAKFSAPASPASIAATAARMPA